MRKLTVVLLALLFAAPAGAGLLAVPKDYTPDQAWPVIICTQDGPSKELAAEAGYFLIHAGGIGVRTGTKVRTSLLRCAEKYNIDPFRIYATSFSRGGQEILAQAWQYPHWYAAVAPMCNDLRREPKVRNVKYLVHTPTLLLHGDHDSFRKSGKRVFELMKQAGCDVGYRTYPGGHSPNPIYRKDLEPLTEFFEKHRLDPYPKAVVHLVSHKRYSRAFWVDSTPIKDAGGMKGVFEVRVRDGNVIEVEASEEIASLSLELCDKLVDMKKPVTVMSGEEQMYRGPAVSPLKLTFREGEQFWQRRRKPLWKEIQEIRNAAKRK
ncbi:MAG: hypothetical protein R6V58_13630 [Planctomycetota bacterium]